MTDTETTHRCGFVSIIGAPNAGKSTLLNSLVGAKVAIITPKIQTTRVNLRGVAMAGDAQIVFIDTPGIFQPKRRLDRAMTRAAWDAADEGDVIAHLIDARAEIAVLEGAKGADRHSVEDTQAITDQLKSQNRKAWLVLNKTDTIDKPKLLPLITRLMDTGVYSETYLISAHTGQGVADLKSALAAKMPVGEWHYPEDQVADAPMRALAAEITREKLMLRVHQELPYVLAVETEKFEERKDGSARIEQTIYVERESQRAIILGDKGQVIKGIGQKSRADIAELLGKPVHLFLHVKVKPDWADDRGFYKRMGLQYEA